MYYQTLDTINIIQTQVTEVLLYITSKTDKCIQNMRCHDTKEPAWKDSKQQNPQTCRRPCNTYKEDL